jgi:hypothetical protein
LALATLARLVRTVLVVAATAFADTHPPSAVRDAHLIAMPKQHAVNMARLDSRPALSMSAALNSGKLYYIYKHIYIMSRSMLNDQTLTFVLGFVVAPRTSVIQDVKKPLAHAEMHLSPPVQVQV